jgi:hypothetical protein
MDEVHGAVAVQEFSDDKLRISEKLLCVTSRKLQKGELDSRRKGRLK